MLTAKLNAKLTSLLFRASKLQQLIDNERYKQRADMMRVMRLNSIRLRVLSAMHQVLNRAFQQPVAIPVLADGRRQRR